MFQLFAVFKQCKAGVVDNECEITLGSIAFF